MTTKHDAMISDLRQAQTLIQRCVDGLAKTGPSPAAAREKRRPSVERPALPDFEKGFRSFAKTYGKGLSGPRKFVVVVAWLGKGSADKQVRLADAESKWRKTTALLGSFNRKFTVVARENDWVETKRTGYYNLRPSWQEAFQNGG